MLQAALDKKPGVMTQVADDWACSLESFAIFSIIGLKLISLRLHFDDSLNLS